MNTSEIKDNMYDLYSVYNQYKMLFNFYQSFKNMKTTEQIQERIDYILKNQIKQRNELETLLWVLGKDDDAIRGPNEKTKY